MLLFLTSILQRCIRVSVASLTVQPNSPGREPLVTLDPVGAAVDHLVILIGPAILRQDTTMRDFPGVITDTCNIRGKNQ